MKTILLNILLLLNFGVVFAQSADDASDAVYSDGWTTGDNGGSGFGSWSLSTSTGDGSQAGLFISGPSNTESDLGVSWALYANSSQLAEAFRPLNIPLPIDEMLSVDLDNGSIDNGGSVGISYLNGSGEVILEVYFQGGDANYTVRDATGERNSGVPFTNSGLSITYTAKAGGMYEVAVGSTVISGNLISTSSDDFEEIRFFNFNAGGGETKNAYFNNLVASVVLPVTWQSFTLSPSTKGLLLEFSTATESGNDYFEVQRSTDAKTWYKLGTITGAGTTNEAQHYTFKDEAPFSGLNVYRIKQVDFDGSFSYSMVRRAIWDSKDLNPVVYPNPAQDLVFVQDVSPESIISLLDLQGRMVRSQAWSSAGVDLAGLSPGLYQLQVSEVGQIVSTTRLIVQ